MTNRMLIAAAAVSAVLSGAACGGTTRQNAVTTVPAASSVAPVTIQVTNNHPQDIDVYLTDGQDRWRVGTIATAQTQTFTVPSAATRGGTDLRVLIHPIGGGGNYSTGRVAVSPGDEVQVTVAPAIGQTSFTVSQR